VANGKRKELGGLAWKLPRLATTKGETVMASKKVSQSSAESTPVVETAGINQVEYSAICLEAVSKSLEKASRRDDIADGTNCVVDLMIAARINNGPVWRHTATCDFSVGHTSERASSTISGMNKLLAYVMGKLNEATREAILRDLVGEYQTAGCEFPDSPKEIESATENMLKQIRACKKQVVRGTVNSKPRDARPPLTVFNGK